MDIRSINNVEPEVEHNGTVPVWWLVSPREMFDITKGGHLELVSEFEVAGGGADDNPDRPRRISTCPCATRPSRKSHRARCEVKKLAT